MKKALTLAVLVLASAVAFAHPGVGIVMDTRGNVFYTDLKHVWKIPPEGMKSIAVSNVHTHELYIDAQDNLYGEHLWYEGEAIDKWGHRVWCLKADGTVLQIIPAREGFREDYKDFFFVRDRAGNMYWADRGEQTVIRKRTPGGTITDLCKAHHFGDVRWMTATPEGTIFLIDGRDLRRISTNEEVTTLARDLAERKLLNFFVGDRHLLMGLWTDRAENVYVAVYGAGVVKKIGKHGTVSIAAESSMPWSPTGGLVAPNGDLWLLEYSVTNAARARCISRDGSEKTF